MQIRYEIDPDGDFKLLFDVGDGRSQVAFVNSRTERFGTLEIREIWSIAHVCEGPLDPELADRLLERNRQVKFGAWGVERRGDRRHVVFTVHLSANADADALTQTLQLVLSLADQLERELTGARDAL
jgi:hypothetical protein